MFYVGMTSQLEQRIRNHGYDGLREIAVRQEYRCVLPNAKAEQIANIITSGHDMRVMILDNGLTYGEARKIEREWIQTVKSLGEPITNV
jgi:hypothetical protein